MNTYCSRGYLVGEANRGWMLWRWGRIFQNGIRTILCRLGVGLDSGQSRRLSSPALSWAEGQDRTPEPQPPHHGHAYQPAVTAAGWMEPEETFSPATFPNGIHWEGDVGARGDAKDGTQWTSLPSRLLIGCQRSLLRDFTPGFHLSNLILQMHAELFLCGSAVLSAEKTYFYSL